MSFSAGGTNVSGVLTREQGTLKINTIDGTPSGAGEFVIQHTVPTNKVWTIKGIAQTDGSPAFDGTMTNRFTRVNDGTLTSITQQSASYIRELIGNHNIQLKQGQSFESVFTITAYTSGNIRSRLLYIESDEQNGTNNLFNK